MVPERNGETAEGVKVCGMCGGERRIPVTTAAGDPRCWVNCPACVRSGAYSSYLCEACGSTDPVQHYDGCRETRGLEINMYDPLPKFVISPKTLDVKLRELQANRKLQHRTFKRTSDGDLYTVLMFAHFGSNLVVVVQLCAIAQVKEVLPFDNFAMDFVQTDTGGTTS